MTYAKDSSANNKLTLFPQGNLYFGEPDVKAVEARIISPGVHADFNRNSKLIGIEIIDASEIMGKKIEFRLPEVALPERS